MTRTRKATFIFWTIITIIPVVGIVFSLTDPKNFADIQNVWRDRIVPFGILAPVTFIFIQALQVIFTPISHYSVGVVGGFLYGPLMGSLLNWIGRVIGHTGAFLIAHFFRDKVAERFVSKETLNKYDKYVADKSFILFLIYFVPVFPDDEMTYLAGFSTMKFRAFLIANLFGQVGGSLGLAYLGSGIDTKDTLFWILSGVTILGFILLWWVMKKHRVKT